MGENKYKYDVALSFAGEQRSYVDKVAMYLRNHEINVFYDRFEETDLWGVNLINRLEQVYTHESCYCVMFISKDYAQKGWTCHEAASVTQRMLKENVNNSVYLLPVKFDDTKIPGIFDTLGYIDANDCSPEDVAKRIMQKIKSKSRKIYTLTTLIDELCSGIKSMKSNGVFCEVSNIGHRKVLQFVKFKRIIYQLHINISNTLNNKNFLEIYDSFADSDIYLESPCATVSIYLNDHQEIINIEVDNWGFRDTVYNSSMLPDEFNDWIKDGVLYYLQRG